MTIPDFSGFEKLTVEAWTYQTARPDEIEKDPSEAQMFYRIEVDVKGY